MIWETSTHRHFLAITVALFSGIHLQVWGQQMEWTFVDEARNNREIPVSLKFDLDQTGPFPLVVLGHGFLMGPEDYDGLCGFLTEAGFAVALLGTETGLTPSHEDFGADMAFVANHATAEVGGALQGLISSNTALVGHSMGGGAAWLAAATLGTALEAVVGWAPAETAPSAVAAAASIAAPALVISGTADAITPPETSHTPIYEALPASTCRAFAALENGSHCGFADSGTLCDLGEFGFEGMSREVQQAHSGALTVAWLKHHLMGEAAALSTFESYGGGQDEVNLTLSCAPAYVALQTPNLQASCHPNPVQSTLYLSLPWMPESALIKSGSGRTITAWIPNSGNAIDVSAWPAGVYFLYLTGKGQQQTLRFVKTP